MKSYSRQMTKVFSLCLIGVMAVSSMAGCDKSTKNTSFGAEVPFGTEPAIAYDADIDGDFAYFDSTYYDDYYSDDYYSDDYYRENFNTEEYNYIKENSFSSVATNPLSTFAIDVDTGSYGNLRRMIEDGYSLISIPSGAVRTEEILNYFDYEVKTKSEGKFSVGYEVHTCPWNTENGLLLMTVEANDTPEMYQSNGNNFVFLIDTSGSMFDSADLVVSSFKKLASQLDSKDVISIVTYSGSFSVVLDGCKGDRYQEICRALDSLYFEGCTNGEGGIVAAYDCATKHFIENGNNRVILASDGDMNVGVTSQSELVELIKEKKESGVFLTTLGFGWGNYSDANMESIADAGNGNYFYIDNEREAERVLVDKLMQNTCTVAKDVKLQAEFNPNTVSEYRLIGYENRTLNAKDFNDDTKDGGEVGASQQVTVMYEIVWASGEVNETLKYQKTVPTTDSKDILTMSIRYKEPTNDSSVLEEYIVTNGVCDEVSNDWKLAAGIAEFVMLINNSSYIGTCTLDEAYSWIKAGIGDNDYRNEFAALIFKLGANSIDLPQL